MSNNLVCYVQEWFSVDIPGYVYQLRLAEHWFDGIDKPRYTIYANKLS